MLTIFDKNGNRYVTVGDKFTMLYSDYLEEFKNKHNEKSDISSNEPIKEHNSNFIFYCEEFHIQEQLMVEEDIKNNCKTKEQIEWEEIIKYNCMSFT